MEIRRCREALLEPYLFSHPSFQTMEEKDLNYIKVRAIDFVELPLLTKYR